MLSARVRLFRKGYGNYLEKDMATHTSILPGEFHGQEAWWATVHGVRKRHF